MRRGLRSLMTAGRGAAASEAGEAAQAAAGAAQGAEAGPRVAATAAQGAEAGPRADGWRRMPPLELTIEARPMLVGGPLLRAPDVSGTRSLIRRPGGNAAGGAWDSGAWDSGAGDSSAGDNASAVPAGGRVGGLVVPRPEPESRPEPQPESRSAVRGETALRRVRDRAARGIWQAGRRGEPDPAGADASGGLPLAGQAPGPPARATSRPAVRATAGERPSLVRATSEFVGDPRADETPYASSAWLRMVQAYRQLPAEGAAAASQALPGLTESVTEGGGTVLSWSSATVMAPPHAAQPGSAAPAARQEAPQRRASLAESRRLGIGRPLAGDQAGSDPGDQVQADTTSAGAGVPRAGHEADEAGPAAAGAGQAGTGEDSTAHPGTPYPGMAYPGAAHPGAAHPGTAHPGAAHPGAAHPGTGHPGTGQAGSAQAGTGQASRAGPGKAAGDAAGPLTGTRAAAARTGQQVPPRLGLGAPITLRGVPFTGSPGDGGNEPGSGTRQGQRPGTRPGPDSPRGSQGGRQEPFSPEDLNQAILQARSSPSGAQRPVARTTGAAARTAREDGSVLVPGPLAQAGPAAPGEARAAGPGTASVPSEPGGAAPLAGASRQVVVTPVYRAAGDRPHVKLAPAARAAAAEPLVHPPPATQPPAAEPPPAPASATTPAPAAAEPAPGDQDDQRSALPPAPPIPDLLFPGSPFPIPPFPAGPAGAGGFGLPGAMTSRDWAGEAADRRPVAADPAASPPAAPDAGGQAADFGRVPYDLADSLRRRHGVDVSDVVVSRGQQAGREADALGARAFTRAGEIVLPPGAGPIERPEVRALLAHELTHAAQQRALGPSLPPADSAAGAALERAAVATERRVLGADAPGRPGWTAIASPALVHALPQQQAQTWQAPAAPAPAAVQRQGEEVTGTLPGNAFDPFALLPGQGTEPGPDLAAEVRALQAALAGVPGTAAPDAELGLARDRLLELAGRRLLDLDDSLAVGELADGIYKRIRARLQRELLVDRERSGLLSDFR